MIALKMFVYRNAVDGGLRLTLNILFKILSLKAKSCTDPVTGDEWVIGEMKVFFFTRVFRTSVKMNVNKVGNGSFDIMRFRVE